MWSGRKGKRTMSVGFHEKRTNHPAASKRRTQPGVKRTNEQTNKQTKNKNKNKIK
jgi:hypothetical protein